MDISPGLNLIRECTGLLREALDVFEQKIGRPEFVGAAGKERFRYKTPTAQIFQVIKAVRIVSSYNACTCLLANGFAQESGAQVRMIYEFLHDIDFIQQGLESGQMTANQQEMLDLFFEEDLPWPEERLATHSKKATVVRKKVYAEVARGLRPENPDRIQRIIRLIEEVYSGYVHGAYPHAMELYIGGDWKYFTDGMSETRRPLEMLRAVVLSLSQALNQFAALAASFGDKDLFNRLVAQRNKLELSEFYGKAG